MQPYQFCNRAVNARDREAGPCRPERGRSRRGCPFHWWMHHDRVGEAATSPQISKGRSMGPEKSLDQKIQGSGYIFHVTALFAALRAVPHVLMKHDSKLSAKHQRLSRPGGRGPRI